MGKFPPSEKKTNRDFSMQLKVRSGSCQKLEEKLRRSFTTTKKVLSRISRLSSILDGAISESSITQQFEKRLRKDGQQVIESMQPRAMASMLEESYAKEITSGRTREVYRKHPVDREISSKEMIKRYHRHLKGIYQKRIKASSVATRNCLSKLVWREPPREKLTSMNGCPSIVVTDDGNSVYITPSQEVDRLAFMFGEMTIFDDSVYCKDSYCSFGSEFLSEDECEDYDGKGEERQEEISLSITNMLHQIRKEVDEFQSMTKQLANTIIADGDNKRKLHTKRKSSSAMESSSDDEEEERLVRAAKRKFLKPRRERNVLKYI
jgi:hypothetical protein